MQAGVQTSKVLILLGAGLFLTLMLVLLSLLVVIKFDSYCFDSLI